jgi:DNA-binding ferritin-like protein (Dps family)
MRKRKKGMTARIALSLLNKVIEIQKKNPEMTQRVDALQKDLVAKMQEILAELQTLGDRERELMTVSIINFIHEKADDIFLE